MKKIHIILLAMFGLVFASCQKNELSYPCSDLDTNTNSELRVLNVIPVTGTCDTLLINGQNYSSVSTTLGGYIPFSTTKYLAVPIGIASISLKYNAKTTTPAVSAFTYTNSVTLTSGKWSAYIYNASKAPALLQDADDVPTTDAWADTVCFIRVANFFFQSDGVTPFGNITLKAKKNITGATWETVASDIAFGTQTAAYYKYSLKNTAASSPWSGTETNITFAVFDGSGNQLQYYASTSSTAQSAYSSTGWSLGKGRAYVIYLNGKQGTSNATQFIRLGSYTAK
ncbi:MAG: hypothetical protein H6Q17_2809 [Bacteroidetes bacterium]|nr:hypothetical protein [Bacteroidota bacterium]